jgi:hypothetical protein
MAQPTLQSYVTDCQRLLHDANAVFYTVQELTDYINDGRERVARDTGCTRSLQITQVPANPTGLTSVNPPIAWVANGAATTGTLVFYNIYTYTVVSGGTFSDTPPPYPGNTGYAQNTYPPSTPFTNGTVTLQYAGPVEIIPYASLPQGINTLDIVNVNIYWGNTRYPLLYKPWTQFNAELRYWQNYVGQPVCFSIYGQQQIYLSPVPDQIYTLEVDTVLLTTSMTNLSDTETQLNDPYTRPVAYYACYKAKFKEQSYGESEIFKQQYNQQIQAALASTFTRRMPSPYLPVL